MNEVTLAVPNAILFVFDMGNSGVLVPEYVPGQLTSANDSCLSIATQAEVDGDVIVRLGNKLTAADKWGCSMVSEHTIQTPSRSVAVVTSEFQKILEVAVDGHKARLTIAVDDPRSPAKICIEAQ